LKVYSDAIDFGVQGGKLTVQAGSLIALNGDVPYDLVALEDSIVRLSLSKKDSVARVQAVKGS